MASHSTPRGFSTLTPNRTRIQPGSATRINFSQASPGNRLMASPNPMNKRPRFENALSASKMNTLSISSGSPGGVGVGDNDESVRLCTLSPHEINLAEEEHRCFFDRSGWVLSINDKGTIGAWEIHHTLTGEAPRAPRKVYTFEQPTKVGTGYYQEQNNENTIHFACLLSTSTSTNSVSMASENSERRALVGGSMSGDIYYWSDVKTHLGHAVVAVSHSLFGTDNQNRKSDDFLVSLIPIEGKMDEVLACTRQGRAFRIVCNSRLREVHHEELTKSGGGWRDMLSNVVFKNDPAYFSSAKCLHPTANTPNNSNATISSSVLILSEKSLSLWSGSDSLNFNSEAQDLNESLSLRLRQIQGRLDETILIDLVTSNKSGFSWILASSKGPNTTDSYGGSGNNGLGFSTYLSLHRVAVSVGGSLSISDAVANRDGQDDILLIDLNEHRPTQYDKWELLESEHLVPNFLICRHSVTQQIMSVYAASTPSGGEEGKVVSRWDQQRGEGFRTVTFSRKFPSSQFNTGESVLSAGVLEHTSDLFIVANSGETFLFPPAKQLSDQDESREIPGGEGIMSNIKGYAPHDDKADFASGGSLNSLAARRSAQSQITQATSTLPTYSNINPETISESLSKAFECLGDQGTANQISQLLKPVRDVLDRGDKDSMLLLVKSVVDLSVAVVDAPFDGSALVHHALTRKVSEHHRFCLFVEQFVLSTTSTRGGSNRQHPEWVFACAQAKTQVLKHRQQLAAACALREFMSQATTTTQGSLNTNSSQNPRAGFMAQMQQALINVTADFKGFDNLRRLKMTTGLAEYDLFFESPTQLMQRGLEALISQARDCRGGVEVQLTTFDLVISAIHSSLLAAKKVNIVDKVTATESNMKSDVKHECWTFDNHSMLLELFNSLLENVLNSNHFNMDNVGESIAAIIKNILTSLLFEDNLSTPPSEVYTSMSEFVLSSHKHHYFKQQLNTSSDGSMKDSGGIDDSSHYHHAKRVCFDTLTKLMKCLNNSAGPASLTFQPLFKISSDPNTPLFKLCRKHLCFSGLLELCLFHNIEEGNKDGSGGNAENEGGINLSLLSLSNLCLEINDNVGTDGVTFREYVIDTLLNPDHPFYQPSYALKLASVRKLNHDTRLTTAQEEASGKKSKNNSIHQHLSKNLINKPELSWMNELRVGLGMAYDEHHDCFLSVNQQDGMSSHSNQLVLTKDERDGLDDAGCSLLDVALKEERYATRKTMLSLSKLALLASSDGSDVENENNHLGASSPKKYPPLSPFHEKTNINSSLKQDEDLEEKEQFMKTVEMNLALLQLQLKCETSIPSSSQHGLSTHCPQFYEEPHVMLNRIVEAMSIKTRGGNASNKRNGGEEDYFKHGILGIALLDIINSMEGNPDYLASSDNATNSTIAHGVGSEERAGLYYCGMLNNNKKGDILLDLKVDSNFNKCEGQGLGYKGFFNIEIGSEWQCTTNGSSGESVVLLVRSPGGGNSFGSPMLGASVSSNAAMDIHMQYQNNELVFSQGKFIKIDKERATLVRAKIELKLLGIKLWSAIVQQDLPQLLDAIANQNAIDNVSTDERNEMFKATLLWRCVFEHVKGLKMHEFRAKQLCLGWYPTSSSNGDIAGDIDGVTSTSSGVLNNSQHLLQSLGLRHGSDMVYLEDLECWSSNQDQAVSLDSAELTQIHNILRQCISSAQSEALAC